MTGTAAALAALVTIASLAVPGSAAGRAELRVSPLVANLDATAGHAVQHDLAVTASGDEPITVEFNHVDFGFDSSNYQPRLIRDDAAQTTAFSTRDWFHVAKRRYTIAAGKTVVIPVRIKVPRNTPGGTYLGGALVRVVPAKISGGNRVQPVPESGTLVFVRVKGGKPPKPVISEFRLPELVSHGPVTPKIQISNKGDDYFTYEGTVKLTGPGRSDTIKVERQYVVPNQPRSVVPRPMAHGEVAPLQLGSRRLGFGHYRVSTRLRIEPTGASIVTSRRFWIVPTWLRLLALALAVALAASLAVLGRWLLVQARTPPASEVRVPASQPPDDGDGEVFDDDAAPDEDDAEEASSQPEDSDDSSNPDLR